MKKFAIVTGASRGIGREVAIYLAQQQFDLAIIARNQARLEEVVESIRKSAQHMKYRSIDFYLKL
jgi:uncharacterized protein